MSGGNGLEGECWSMDYDGRVHNRSSERPSGAIPYLPGQSPRNRWWSFLRVGAGLIQLRLSQVIVAFKMSSGDVGVRQLGSGKICIPEVRIYESGADQSGISQIGTAKVGTYGIGICEVGLI